MNNFENDKTQLENQPQDQTLLQASKENSKKKKKKSKKAPPLAKGVETMFRSSYRMLLDLTSLADGKANNYSIFLV